MNRFGAPLDAVDMQAAVREVDRVPPQRDELGRPQTVPIRDQHHGGVAMAVATILTTSPRSSLATKSGDKLLSLNKKANRVEADGRDRVLFLDVNLLRSDAVNEWGRRVESEPE
jgi:hypothetical protein